MPISTKQLISVFDLLSDKIMHFKDCDETGSAEIKAYLRAVWGDIPAHSVTLGLRQHFPCEWSEVGAEFDKHVQSTHLIEYGTGITSELCIVCGNYYRALHRYIFGGRHEILAWKRLPAGATLIACVSPMIESAGSGMLNTADNF